LILTDDAEFARLLTACWQVERQLPGICVVTSEFWKEADTSSPDLIVVGPLKDGKLGDVLRSMEPNTALILCAPSEARELGLLRKNIPNCCMCLCGKIGLRWCCCWRENPCGGPRR